MFTASTVFAILGSSAEHCCTTCDASAGLAKYYSVASPLLSKHQQCGECCMDPKDFNKYHLFEKNLTKAASNTPCADFGFTSYLETDTHGFGPVKMTLDMYKFPAAAPTPAPTTPPAPPAPAGATYTCPDYSAIRRPTVAPDVLTDIRVIDGSWYLVATTEPTTRFCLCNVMNFSVHPEWATPGYRYTDNCFQDLSKNGTWNNQTMTIGGDLSYDPASPGILHEGFVLLNHTVTGKKPNMLFDLVPADRAATSALFPHGRPEHAHFYACLGKLVPVVGKPVFSYLLYSRDPSLSDEQIEALMAPDRAEAGVFDLEGVVKTNASTWRTCSVR